MRPSSKLLALALLLVSRAVAADPPRYSLPVALESRPFLLVDAPRRFLPTEPASVRVQRQGGGTLEVAVFRVRTIAAFVATPWPSQGVSVAALPLGRETEGLLAGRAPLPRRGANVDLVGLQRVTVRVRPPVRRAVSNETAAYDSNETDEGSVETWGVHSGDWADESVSLGALPAGVYLVRVNAGGWSSSAVVSVGSLTLLARRGDARDVLTVTDGEGVPQSGVTVQRFVDGAPGERAVTNASGRAELPAADALTARYVAVRGDDVAWADVTHARLPACDARVYVAAGRPVYRPREVAHLRGHARGCVDGRDVPLADEPVEIRNGDEAVIVRTRTDRDGNFLADLPATDEITARMRGRDHRRTLHIDGRPLPRRALRLRFDRPWAAAGEPVTATLSDDLGGWPTPATATFRTPAGLATAPISPGHPATFTFTMPPTEEALARVTVRADIPDGAAVTYAEADLWTGATRDVLELASERTNGLAGQPFPLRLVARDLGGRETAARATLRVYGTDGNHRLGAARSEQTVALPHAANVRLDGAGPWWIEASAAGDTSARATSLVVWERVRPPALSSRGELAVAVPNVPARPGTALTVSLRTPALGNTLVTLEQGGLWSSRIVTPAQSGAVQLPVPEGARGAATVVATHVHGGQVNHATVAVEVETSRKLGLTVRTDQRSYNASSTARVTVRARNTDGTPRDAVLSLWVADAGWWEIADENHPSPNEWFRLPGRPASAGDSTRPRAFGAEEGRHYDPALEWNGRPLRGTTFRHTWTSTAPLVNFDSEGSFAAAADRLARAAGFARAEVCASANQAAGSVRVRARQIPWDLAAVRFAERADTGAEVVGDVLHFDCGVGLGGSGSGMGAGGLGSGAGRGMRGGGASPTQTMDGTIFFLGLRRLGPTGEVTIDVPLPARAGRWRVEALAIADDGAGESAHAEFVSTRPLVAQVELPPSLAAGDVAEGAVTVEAAGLAGREVTVSLDGGERLRLPSFAPRTIALDARGLARVPFTVRAERAGAWTLAATVQGPHGAVERAELPVAVRSDPANEPVDLDTAVGPDETDVELRVPALASPASLEFTVETGVGTGVRAVVASMRDPSWAAPSILLERLRTWAALRDALGTPGVPHEDDLHAAVTHGLRGAGEAVRERMGLTGGLSWWRTLRPDPTLTALVLDLLFDELSADDRHGARELLRAALPTTQRPLALAQIAAALAHDEDVATRALARSALDRALSSDAGPDALAAYECALAAAKTLGDAARATSAATRLAAAVDRTLSNDQAARCRGAAWFVCLRGDGDRARMARAARALALHDAVQRPRAASALAWITRHPVRRDGPWWGQDEAAVVALQAVFPSNVIGGMLAVRLDGREIGRVGGAAGTWLQVPGEGVLTVSFPRQPGRGGRLRVRGELPTAPRTTAVGTAPFARRIEGRGSDVALVMEFTLAAAGRDIELHAPLPARWAPAGRAGANDATGTGGHRADRWGFDLSGWDWYALDRTPSNQSPRVDYADGAVRVRYGALLPGRHVVRVPLTEVARGTFRAGAAWLRADGGRVWALTPPLGP